MKNIIIVGDSFCSSIDGWPSMLADLLNLNLIWFGAAGSHWWSQAHFLHENISKETKENTEVIVFAHTESHRVPTLNSDIYTVNKNNNKTDLERAVRSYYKYIMSSEFMDWAQDKWFEEISNDWGSIKTVHLHSFPWTLDKINLLKGMNVYPSLLSLCLNEVGAKTTDEIPDSFVQLNHLNSHNNIELAKQLSILINDYKSKEVHMDVSNFDAKITSWTSWKGN